MPYSFVSASKSLLRYSDPSITYLSRKIFIEYHLATQTDKLTEDLRLGGTNHQRHVNLRPPGRDVMTLGHMAVSYLNSSYGYSEDPKDFMISTTGSSTSSVSNAITLNVGSKVVLLCTQQYLTPCNHYLNG